MLSVPTRCSSELCGVWALCFACLLIPIGTEALTGLVCIMLLALLMLLHMKRRVLYGELMAFAVIVSIPFLPASFTNRMDTIENYKSDESASTDRKSTRLNSSH